jgi:hypothetical protein
VFRMSFGLRTLAPVLGDMSEGHHKPLINSHLRPDGRLLNKIRRGGDVARFRPAPLFLRSSNPFPLREQKRENLSKDMPLAAKNAASGLHAGTSTLGLALL